MRVQTIFSPDDLHRLAKARFAEERTTHRLDGWFLTKEIARACAGKYDNLPAALQAAETLREIARTLPVSISEHAIFAGTQNDSFARSYALINPAFKVDSFTGYCDPTAVYNDIEPDENLSAERIADLCDYTKNSEFSRELSKTYEKVQDSTSEAVFFIEQVTGHLIPDFKPVLAEGIASLSAKIALKKSATMDEDIKNYYAAMDVAMDAILVLADRYADCAASLKQEAQGQRKDALILMEHTLRRIPREGARNLYEAIQSFTLLWQMMCLEQAPNPFAFSVGNADRIFEPYRAMEGLSREDTAALFKHFLVFFNVGDRSWAISQNIIVSGKDVGDKDLTNPASYALLDAYYEMNLPQPILSVKLHQHTPQELYQSLGRFFFTPGCLTPSLFNDDSLFEVLAAAEVEKADLENYSIAGCQEPLIMGQDNGNTTNSWLNLAKILELTIQGGISGITGKKLGLSYSELDVPGGSANSVLAHIRDAFYRQVDYFTDKMVDAANGASAAISLLPVPFLSTFMGGVESGIDMRDTKKQGTKYNGSGCLIHGLSIIADSFVAIDSLLAERPQDAARLLHALKTNYAHDEELRQYLLQCAKYGNNVKAVDLEAREIATRINELVASKKNYLGNPFRPDWSSPSTHLLYGYWVGATPDGRKSREMLGYGIDPLFGDAHQGMGFRVLSNMKLPFKGMNGGYASHFGIDPNYFSGKSFAEKGIEFRDKVINPLFFNRLNQDTAPFYLYVNVTTPETLRKVLKNPGKYAPSGVYIMRIHGTFVNFLDLSPEIQEDIIRRLDLRSTSLA